MFKRLILPAAVLLFAGACQTESAAPEWIDLPASLNFGVPHLKQLVQDKPRVLPEAPLPASPEMLASAMVGGEQLPSDYAELLASGWLIAHPSEAETRFRPADHIAYAQALGTSKGSFYRNAVHLRLYRDGSQISEVSGEESESCNCTHIRNPWGMTANTTIAVAGDCGLTASAYAKHVARLDWTSGSGTVYNLLSGSDSGTDHDHQPSCPPGQPGGGGNPDDEQWYICYWEDYYNPDGSFSHRVDLGCHEVNVS